MCERGLVLRSFTLSPWANHSSTSTEGAHSERSHSSIAYSPEAT